VIVHIRVAKLVSQQVRLRAKTYARVSTCTEGVGFQVRSAGFSQLHADKLRVGIDIRIVLLVQ
jgi:hypothetical protein